MERLIAKIPTKSITPKEMDELSLLLDEKLEHDVRDRKDEAIADVFLLSLLEIRKLEMSRQGE